MIQLLSKLNAADNSGAKQLQVIALPTKLGKTATVGDVVNCVVHGAIPAGNVENKEKVKVLIVRTSKEVGRPDGTYVRFDDNAGVVIDKNGMPIGTRILGPVAREIKDRGYKRIVSLAREVV